MKHNDQGDLVWVDDFILETPAYDERGQLDDINNTRAIGGFVPKAPLAHERDLDRLS
jgi:hypothetical protein